MLPNLIIIGAAKCGTTSLHRYLDLHPHISMSELKEPNFFTGPAWNWDRGLDWYESQFPEATPIRGESSHTYTAHPFARGVPERMRSILPRVKLIYIVGDPIERIISQYLGELTLEREDRSLAEVCSDPGFPEGGYMYRSRHHHQLERYLEHFPREAILVVCKEDLASARKRTLAEIFRFLGVDDSFSSPGFELVHNPSSEMRRSREYVRLLPAMGRVAGYASSAPGRFGDLARRAFSRRVDRPVLEDSLRQELIGLLAADVASLRELTGMRFESWCL